MKIAVCLTGNNFPGSFLMSWTKLFRYLIKQGYEVDIRKTDCANVYMAREMILVSDIFRGKDQQIFDGMDYDYTLWIDRDQVFEPAHFEMLMEADKDIVSAAIKCLPAMQFACGTWSEGVPKKFDFFKHEDRLIEVDWTGFGFTLIKKGVFEKIGFPFFEPVLTSEVLPYKGGYLSEDLSFCIHAKEKGFSIFVDTKCRVLHEKAFLI